KDHGVPLWPGGPVGDAGRPGAGNGPALSAISGGPNRLALWPRSVGGVGCHSGSFRPAFRAPLPGRHPRAAAARAVGPAHRWEYTDGPLDAARLPWRGAFRGEWRGGALFRAASGGEATAGALPAVPLLLDRMPRRSPAATARARVMKLARVQIEDF